MRGSHLGDVGGGSLPMTGVQPSSEGSAQARVQDLSQQVPLGVPLQVEVLASAKVELPSTLPDGLLTRGAAR